MDAHSKNIQKIDAEHSDEVTQPVNIPHRKDRSQSLSSINYSHSSILQKLGLSSSFPISDLSSSPTSTAPPGTPPVFWDEDKVEGKHENEWDTSADMASAGSSPSDVWWIRPTRRGSIGPGWTSGKKEDWSGGGGGDSSFGVFRGLSFGGTSMRPSFGQPVASRTLPYPVVPPPTPATNNNAPLPGSPGKLGNGGTALPTLEEKTPARGRRKRVGSVNNEPKKRKISPHGERLLMGGGPH